MEKKEKEHKRKERCKLISLKSLGHRKASTYRPPTPLPPPRSGEGYFVLELKSLEGNHYNYSLTHVWGRLHFLPNNKFAKLDIASFLVLGINASGQERLTQGSPPILFFSTRSHTAVWVPPFSRLGTVGITFGPLHSLCLPFYLLESNLDYLESVKPQNILPG